MASGATCYTFFAYKFGEMLARLVGDSLLLSKSMILGKIPFALGKQNLGYRVSKTMAARGLVNGRGPRP